jgi:hypothetical protein
MVEKMVDAYFSKNNFPDDDKRITKDILSHFGISINLKEIEGKKVGSKHKPLTRRDIAMLSPRVNYREIVSEEPILSESYYITPDGKRVEYLVKEYNENGMVLIPDQIFTIGKKRHIYKGINKQDGSLIIPLAPPEVKEKKNRAPKESEPYPSRPASELFTTPNPDGITFSSFGPDFTSYFSTQNIETIPTPTLKSFLTDSYINTDTKILEKLGGEAKAETSLSDLYAMLKQQKKQGDTGPLLTDGNWNIFYIKDASSTLRAVGVLWDGDGWRVYAGSRGGYAWLAGYLVFSR